MITALTAMLVSFGCPYARAESLASDVAAVVATERPIFGRDRSRERTARLLAVWAWHESSGRADAIGDGGRACGVMQLHDVARQGTPCAEILRDRRLGLRLGLRWIARSVEVCRGNVTRGLAAYASGSCYDSGPVERLVRNRMQRARVTAADVR